MDFAFKDYITGITYSPPTYDLTVRPFILGEAKLQRYDAGVGDYVDVVGLRNVSIVFENNLRARYIADASGELTVKSLVEGALRCSGRFTVDEDYKKFADKVKGLEEFNIKLVLVKGTDTIEIVCENAMLEEYVDRIRGLEAYEPEFPFRCRPSGQYTLVTVTQTTDKAVLPA